MEKTGNCERIVAIFWRFSKSCDAIGDWRVREARGLVHGRRVSGRDVGIGRRSMFRFVTCEEVYAVGRVGVRVVCVIWSRFDPGFMR